MLDDFSSIFTLDLFYLSPFVFCLLSFVFSLSPLDFRLISYLCPKFHSMITIEQSKELSGRRDALRRYL